MEDARADLSVSRPQSRQSANGLIAVGFQVQGAESLVAGFSTEYATDPSGGNDRKVPDQVFTPSLERAEQKVEIDQVKMERGCPG